ncbi:MAG: hypothetical protein GKR92_02495 [Gammaproteobacteria bacterium]|nr:MAG: hypothetical protein GKR92_02495 [Gammaproteobacteria bacterium]
MKYLSTILFITLLFFCFNSFASEEHVCTNGDAMRVISVAYQDGQNQMPCEVNYDKGEGVQTLWSAKSEIGYCESKAREFIEKHESWGWSCENNQQAVNIDDLVTELF